MQVDTIEAWIPLFLFSVLFGLSMDYHVFLLSRIRERYLTRPATPPTPSRSASRTVGPPHHRRRPDHGGGVRGFAAGELVMFQQMGFGLAVAVLVDATLVRTILVPATMRLLGRWNWYLPSRL